jgi:hypothetical protein
MATMQEKRPPTSIKLVAALQILFGALGLVDNTVLLAMLGVGLQGGAQIGSSNDPVTQAEIDLLNGVVGVKNALPGGIAVVYGQVGAEALLSALMLASGIGLLKLRPWGRPLAICYALASLLFKAGFAVYLLVYSIPAMNQLADELASRGTEHRVMAVAARILAYYELVEPGIVAIYPLIVLWFMLKASTRAAFHQDAAAPEVPPAVQAEAPQA